jgi:hypothetical protein
MSPKLIIKGMVNTKEALLKQPHSIVFYGVYRHNPADALN